MGITDGMMTSEYDDYNTPLEVLEPVREFCGGQIGLDPCSNATSIVNARREYRLDRGEDGIKLTWAGFGLVFGNFPYGDGIGPFMRRADYWGIGGVEIIALIPHRTDPDWYQHNVEHVAAKCEWNGRLVHPRAVADSPQVSLFPGALPPAPAEKPGSAPFPSALLYWGPRARRFARIFDAYGRVWR